MELKRILARDLRAATEKAVSLYGTDALVVSHEQVNGQTEVIVAVDIEPSFKREDLEFREIEPDANANPSPDELERSQVEASEDLNLHDQPKNGAPEFEAIFNQTLGPATKGSKNKRTKAEPVSANDPSDSHRDQLRAREIVDIVRQEMAVLRRELRLQQQLTSLEPVGLSSIGQALHSALENLGVSTASRVLLIDEIQSEETLEAAIQKAEVILTASLPKTISKVPTEGIHVVFGSSGSGKTQSVTRLSQRAAEAWGAEQVAVISYCDNRLGAWSQLQLGCSRSGLEAFRVTEPSLLPSLLEELQARRAIIIDTSGPQLKSHCDEISKQIPKAEMHLALPCDISLTQALQLFNLHSWDDLILTKLDESAQCWGLVQALQQKPIALMNEASMGVGALSCAPMSGKVLASLAIEQLSSTIQDSQSADTVQMVSGLSAVALSTISSGFQPTQSVLAPKQSS